MANKYDMFQLCKVLVDLLLFYTTAFFVLLATISIFALMFLGRKTITFVYSRKVYF